MQVIGEVRAADQVSITAETDGQVVEVRFRSGQPVRSGEVLIQLNDAIEQGHLVEARARYQLSLDQVRRIRELRSNDAAAGEELDLAEADVKIRQGELAALQAAVNQKQIRAPFGGELGIRRIDKGQYVSAGTPLVLLASQDKLYVDFRVPERHLAPLHPRSIVEVALDSIQTQGGNAVVEAIDPIIDSESRTAMVRAALANPPAGIRPGSFVRVSVPTSSPLPVVLIPESAIERTAAGETVYVFERGKEAQNAKVVRRAVHSAGRANGLVGIESGVAPGELVVTSGQAPLSDNLTVRALSNAAAASSTGTAQNGTAQ